MIKGFLFSMVKNEWKPILLNDVICIMKENSE